MAYYLLPGIVCANWISHGKYWNSVPLLCGKFPSQRCYVKLLSDPVIQGKDKFIDYNITFNFFMDHLYHSKVTAKHIIVAFI